MVCGLVRPLGGFFVKKERTFKNKYLIEVVTKESKNKSVF
jgi:hypothetical protein